MDRVASPLGKLVAAAGVAFAALVFFGTSQLNVLAATSDQKILDWWADSSNRTMSIVSMFCFIFASLLFLVLLGYLRTRIGSADRETALLSTIMFSSGVLFAVFLAAAGVARGLIAAAVAYQDERLPGVDTLRFVPQFSYGFLSAGLLAAALMILATSLLTLRTAIFGRWLGWLGLLAAALIASTTVALGRPFGIPLVLVWALATSFAVWRDRESISTSSSSGS